MPATSRRYPFLDHPGPIPFAHRGGALYPPNVGIENSMTAFANAIELGYRYLETDVHATADGVLVAFHDPTLDRVTDRSGRIADLPYAEVARARIAGREPIPTLAEILGTWPDVRVNIDVKHENAIRPLAEAVAKTNAHDRICVSSFSGHRTKAVYRLLGPRVATGATPLGVASLTVPLPQLLRRLVLSDAACVQVPVSFRGLRIVTPDFVDRVHALGKQVHVWTIDDAAQMNDLLDMGVDGIITDRIDTLRDVLTARGQWVE
ncbi:glycerophosphodiester phosphodiesterase [Thermasporomyces composti]|uniref:Glycerophosphoryl diester phosphodiesterase n=1 Tax=Thermasporomyces composti TaxID=696763 RepID=A0A3D9UZJ3_THECX|nr:glycerophosphodiester phosphodiesterase [Thermasporomyces composti]REF34649.1 glycerophosphoryl diester phosphodiesterase [Thermasporomyces composti]